MSNEAADAPTRDEERPEPTTFTLVVVSPSVGVTGPLTFPHLLADTTVKQLKARIRDVLPTKPADENQRLIHRGRLLGRESETMTDIFGHDTLVNPESQTLHLVLRPATADIPPPQAPSQPTQAQPPPVAPHTHVHIGAQPPRMPPPPRNLGAGLPAQQPLPGFQAVQHLAHMHHQQHHFQASMNVRLQQLQQEADRIQQRLTAIDQIANGQNPPAPGPSYTLPPPPPTLPQILGNPQAVQGAQPAGLPSFQNLIAQHQRDRAAEGMHGASGHSTPSGLPQPPFSSRASPSVHRPDHSTTYTREGVGPNGERWHVTVNETTTTIPNPAMQSNGQTNGQLNGQTTGNIYDTYPALDVQRTLRSADRAPNDRTSLNRTQSSSPPASSSQGTAAQELAAPSITPRAASLPNTSSPALSVLPNSTASASALVEPVVYILSSPTGPRALLVNNSESFYTPRQQVSLRGRADIPGGFVNPSDIALRNRGDRAARRAIRRGQVHQAAGPEAPVLGHQGNPGAGALAAQFWPHIWLIIRLLIFVWFFTSGNTSWQRVFMISALAIIVFIAHTGALNGIAESLWGPIRRHVDRLLPLAGPEAALVPAVNAAIPQAQPGEVRTQGNGPGTQLNEAEVAARLLEQRRQANGGWLMAQIRRAEHAMLLFLASLVPGVGERHIAAREAEAVAAEQRRIEATNAAEAQNQAQPEAGSEEATRANAAGENPAQTPNGPEAPAHVEAPLVEA